MKKQIFYLDERDVMMLVYVLGRVIHIGGDKPGNIKLFRKLQGRLCEELDFPKKKRKKKKHG